MSLQIKVANKPLPTDYSQITWARYLEIDQFVKDHMPEGILTSLEDGIDAKDLMAFNHFKAQYVAFLAGLEVDELRQAVENHGKVTITDLYNACDHLAKWPDPDDFEQSDTIKISGKTYVRSKSAVDALGKSIQFAKLDWDAWEEGQAVMMLLGQDGEDLKSDHLTLLTAVLFREPVKSKSFLSFKRAELIPEPYDYEKALKRAEMFKQAPASDIIGAYFFLTQEQHKLLSDSQKSLTISLKKLNKRRWIYLPSIAKQDLTRWLGYQRVIKWLRTVLSIGYSRD